MKASTLTSKSRPTRATLLAVAALALASVGLTSCDKARNDSISMVNRGVLAYEGGEPDMATDYFRRAIQIFPENDLAHYHLGLIERYQHENIEAAREHFLEAYRLNADSPDAAFQLGSLYLEEGKPDTAQSYLERAIQGDPANHQAHYQLGRVFEVKRKFEEADAAYRHTIRTYPLYPPAFHALGSLYLQFGEAEAAVGVLEEGIRLNPDSAELHTALGRAYMEAGKTEAAVDAFQRSVAIEPQIALGFYNLGIAYERDNQPRQALELLRKFIELSRADNAGEVRLARAVIDRLLIELDERSRARELDEAKLAAEQEAQAQEPTAEP